METPPAIVPGSSLEAEAAISRVARSGALVARFGAGEADTLADAARQLFTAMAEPLVHDAAGTLLHLVEDRGAAARPHTYYSHGRCGGDIHTDGTYIHLAAPDLVGLLCLRQAAVGGETILIDGREVAASLSATARRILSQPHHFDTGDQVAKRRTLVRPILTDAGGVLRFHYLRRYIEAGHRRAGVPLAAASMAAMDELDRALSRRSLRRVWRLVPGDLLLLDNRRVLHGRRAFANAAAQPGRLLVRLWGRLRSRPSAPAPAPAPTPAGRPNPQPEEPSASTCFSNAL